MNKPPALPEVIIAISVVMIFTMTAIVLDLGLIAATQNGLQNAADSASLATASQLIDEDVLTGSANCLMVIVGRASLLTSREYRYGFIQSRLTGRFALP